MTLSLSQQGKSAEDYAMDTVEQRKSVANIAAQIVCAELSKYHTLVKLPVADKAELVAHAVQLAFAIAKSVSAEDVRRHGKTCLD